MRVLLVNDWSATGGGAERYVLDVRDGLRAAGDEVRLLAADVGEGAAVADAVAATSDRRADQAFRQIVNPSAVRKARAMVRSFRPDVALVTMFEMRLSPAVVLALRSVPVVVNIPYYKPICPTGLKLLPDGRICIDRAGRVCHENRCVGRMHWLRDRPRYALISRALAGAAAVITCSRHMVGRLAEAGIGASHRPWPVAAPSPAPRRSPSSRPVLVYAGRLAPEKGVDQLVEAFARLPAQVDGVRLEIVGDGPLRQHLGNAVGAAGLAERVGFHGWASQDELERAYAEAWAVVVPSRWEEPLGLVAVEAIVRGTPVVATAAGGLLEVVDHERTGLLVPRGDTLALAHALGRVVAGDAFPDHHVDARAAEDLARRHEPSAHIDWLRTVLAEVAS
jgi:glycosyltransferase involved in cell wall biosynthesis